MTVLSHVDLEKANRSWDIILSFESPATQATAAALWASLWAEPLLNSVETLLADARAAGLPMTARAGFDGREARP